MVAVIEDESEAGSSRYLEFRVCRSPTDPDRILGIWRLGGGGQVDKTIDENRPDSPVRVEFRYVVDSADQHGIPFVWVNDPDELFPYYDRR